ncbi:MAG TPA: sel1 repeat family protein [Casimicrobiaceae bacterium]|nr:sel1 repeat family protein [Casimicrobiaceae bacterium]
MFTKCPACGSLNVRRSQLRASEEGARGPRLRSPYRCRDCGERFWVISRRANYALGFVTIAVIAGVVAWNVSSSPPPPRPAPTAEGGLAEIIKRAESADPGAEYKLAHVYAGGSGIETDKRQAQAWLERAAEHGNVEAQYELGNELRDGAGVIQDYDQAARWLTLAASRGHGDAQYALGQMYHTGVGVPADNVKAYVWFNLAAAQDVAGATLQRDALLRALSPEQVREAQMQARQLSQTTSKSGSLR